MWVGILGAAILALSAYGVSAVWILCGAVACALLGWCFLIAFGQRKS
jgi:hypothetical protein